MRLLVLSAAIAISDVAGLQSTRWTQKIEPPRVVRSLSIEEKIVREAGPQLASLALAIAWRESRFNPRAVSRTRDLGVFQIHDKTAIALHLWHPLDPDENIVAGVGLLRVGLDKYGNEAGARCFFEHPARCGNGMRTDAR